jgi:hypothetical protein
MITLAANECKQLGVSHHRYSTSAGSEDGTERERHDSEIPLAAARLLGSATGRRRSFHLTGGGLIDVRPRVSMGPIAASRVHTEHSQ